METKSVYKVPNGKLLKVFLDFDKEKNLINNIKITGDFFAYPLESIDIIEKELKNMVLEKQVLVEKICYLIKKHNVEFIGVDADSIVDCILRGVKNYD